MTSADAHDASAAADLEYALSSSSEDEHDRLSRQSELHEPFTRRLLERAGIEPGMRVLDVGCRPGDVSFLVYELVGAGDSVVGVDIDTLAERLRAGTGSAGRIRGWPTAIGACATKPPG